MNQKTPPNRRLVKTRRRDEEKGRGEGTRRRGDNEKRR
jgi:hypothetical protein